MVIASVFFYILSAVLLLSALMVVMARNPVHSVLFLILCFVNASGLFLIAGAEFLAMILLIVYVGAVAVLFLFVVMMLDIDFAQLKQGFTKYLPLGMTISIIILVELLMVLGSYIIDPNLIKAGTSLPIPKDVSNTEAIGKVLYTDLVLYFQMSGVILLIAMVGAIVLTLRHKESAKRQNISEQVARNKETAIDIVDVKSGQGV